MRVNEAHDILLKRKHAREYPTWDRAIAHLERAHERWVEGDIAGVFNGVDICQDNCIPMPTWLYDVVIQCIFKAEPAHVRRHYEALAEDRRRTMYIEGFHSGGRRSYEEAYAAAAEFFEISAEAAKKSRDRYRKPEPLKPTKRPRRRVG
jgi:hypothetical protein